MGTGGDFFRGLAEVDAVVAGLHCCGEADVVTTENAVNVVSGFAEETTWLTFHWRSVTGQRIDTFFTVFLCFSGVVQRTHVVLLKQ